LGLAFYERLNVDAFVTEAWFDADQQALTVSLTGGAATTAPAEILVENLDMDGQYQVTRDGEPWQDWSMDEGSLVISTGALSEEERSFVVASQEQADSGAAGEDSDAAADDSDAAVKDGTGCSCSALSGSLGGLWWLPPWLVRRRGSPQR